MTHLIFRIYTFFFLFNEIYLYFYHLQDENELLKFNTFPERLQYTADKITAVFSNISSDSIKTMYQQISTNVRLTYQYKPKCKLKKDVYLIKASRSFSFASPLSEMYDLDKVSIFLRPILSNIVL